MTTEQANDILLREIAEVIESKNLRIMRLETEIEMMQYRIKELENQLSEQTNNESKNSEKDMQISSTV